MPSHHDIRLYLSGLWLLIRGDARGLRPFDISDRGVLRSFWAIAWCAPAILAGWVVSRVEYLRDVPQAGEPAIPFFGKMAVIEISIWVVPTIVLCALAVILRFMPLLRILIVTRNWFAVPVAYASAFISGPVAVLTQSSDNRLATYGSAVLSTAILIVALIANWRLLTTVMGGNPWRRIATLMLLVLSEVLVASEMAKIMGVSKA